MKTYFKKLWRIINCRKHTWIRTYSVFLLSDGPNKGDVCGITLSKVCSKCGLKLERTTFLS